MKNAGTLEWWNARMLRCLPPFKPSSLRAFSTGFTLVEIIVALVILVLFGASFYAVFRGAHEAIRKGERQAELNQVVRMVLTKMGQELRSCYPMEWEIKVPQPEDQTSVEITGRWSFETTDAKDSNGLDIDSIRFTTVAEDPRRFKEASSDMVMVSYFVDTDEQTREEGLVRSVRLLPLLTGVEEGEFAPMAPRGGVPAGEEKRGVLSPLVVSLNLRYYDDDTKTWEDTWDGYEFGYLPAAIEITVGVLPAGLKSAAAGSGRLQPSALYAENLSERMEFFTTVISPMIRTLPIIPEPFEFVPEEEDEEDEEAPAPPGAVRPGLGGLPPVPLRPPPAGVPEVSGDEAS